jgi:hypothetical protein
MTPELGLGHAVAAAFGSPVKDMHSREKKYEMSP